MRESGGGEHCTAAPFAARERSPRVRTNTPRRIRLDLFAVALLDAELPSDLALGRASHLLDVRELDRPVGAARDQQRLVRGRLAAETQA